MEVTKQFKPEALRADEIVEILYNLLCDQENLPPGTLPPSLAIQQTAPTCFDAPAE
jgi:hypothetical protein